MSGSSQAVFISYASQDADAALRICEALRAAGVEVWFDQSELRGGDAWDHKIRHEIRDCALFIPVISANTAARAEGYFRLEWSLAEQRSHMIARNKAFVVPVCLDRTPESGADVPEPFQRVQWTRLPDGYTPPAFTARIIALLGGPIAASGAGTGPVSPPAAVPATKVKSTPRIGSTTIVFVALVTVVFAYVVVNKVWLSKQAQTERHASAAAPASSIPAVPDKSIAVLPFVDMSEKRDQEYFSDGLSEELIDHLSHNADLKVIARTSSFAFKGKNEDMRSIANKLGVANLLEGSVRKAGGQIRITAQLIRASDGMHLWSETYDRRLIDIFKVQDEISTTVAKALNAALTVSNAAAVQSVSRETTNTAAYDLLLQGNYFYWRNHVGDDARAIERFQQALKLDPRYALAWAKLARVYAAQTAAGEITASEADFKAREAVRQALAIDPNCAEAYYARGLISSNIVGDMAAAKSDFEKTVVLDSNGELADRAQSVLAGLAGMQSGRFGHYIAWSRRHLERNPLDTDGINNLSQAQQMAGLLAESAASSRKELELDPAYVGAQAQYAVTLLLMGKNAEALAAAEKESDDLSRLQALACIYWAMGRQPESSSALSALERGFGDRAAYSIAGANAYRGQADAAFTWLDRAYQQRRGSLVYLRFDPVFRSLRGDPRFNALLRKAKLAE